MAPQAVEVEAPTPVPTVDQLKATAKQAELIRKPLKYSGSLDEYSHFDVTPVIGTEFPDLQLTDILNDDTKIRDLAILGKKNTSYRGLKVYIDSAG